MVLILELLACYSNTLQIMALSKTVKIANQETETNMLFVLDYIPLVV